ncbi:hypothetical protein NJ7G_1958 [Natrinema sp. J7-2]|nr:hypothetical protein NJ7G_1958 [Natrinema sp. J7-2]
MAFVLNDPYIIQYMKQKYQQYYLRQRDAVIGSSAGRSIACRSKCVNNWKDIGCVGRIYGIACE